ncbi:RL26 [Hepatospora eriocheir]|uniref:RL26 n=1 Tax=Hepatospora eriocheir TaxID=1081669 RepID=A0A1X0QJ41_9MICR|nr:RL26 [Hepatospora eriocheir]
MICKSDHRSKNRKAHFNADQQTRRILMSSRLSDELRQTYGFKSFPIHKGDTVDVKAGKYKGKTGKVILVSRKSMRVKIDSCTINKCTGGVANMPIHPSNLVITDLSIDEKRQAALDKRKEVYEKSKEFYSTKF